MYKSAIGIFISNVFMVWIILLNNVGPGWEVPVETMWEISWLSLLLAVSLIFSIVMLIICFKQLKTRNVLFKATYFISLFICITTLMFMFWVDGFHGQFWLEDFPKEMYLLTALGANITLFVFTSIGRFKNITNEK